MYIDFYPGAKFALISDPNSGFGQTLSTKLGLDLQGGYSGTYIAQPNTENGKVTYPDSGAMQEIQGIIENRVNAAGIGEIVVQTQGDNQILVEVPGATDANAIQALVSAQGDLEFVPLDRATFGSFNATSGYTAGTKALPSDGATITVSDYGTPLFGGKHVNGDTTLTKAFYDNTLSTPGWAVQVTLDSTASTAFSTWSSANVGSYFMIVLDNKVVSTPYIASAITNGTAEISGNFTVDTAKQLLTVLGAHQMVVEDLDSSVDDLFAGDAAPAPETEIASAAR